MGFTKDYSVRAAYCNHKASDDEIYDIICRIIEPLDRSMDRIKKARKIVIKTNMSWPKDRITYFEGRRCELVDDSVMRAVLKFLRSNTNAQLVATDTYWQHGSMDNIINYMINYIPLLDEFGVEFVDSNQPPFKIYDVPGGGMMFSRYLLSACFADADEVISIAKMKNHAFMGVTLCLKNLFGLPPMLPYGKPRNYFHHIIRLSYVLPDLGLITRPCLNIIDALVGQARREWGGEGRICDALIAGDHVIATDACGAWLMGHNPASDWPNAPFKRDRNSLLVAAENDFGTVNLEDIDFQTEVKPPLAEFDSDEVDSKETVKNWRKTTCEQALFYKKNKDEMVSKYAGEYIFLQDGDIIWHGTDPANLGSRRGLTRGRHDSAIWMKLVDPQDLEGENFTVYERNGHIGL
jgi:uncharacterized protein (DUF362 family)